MSELIPRLDAAFDAWIEAQRAAIEMVRTAEGVPRTGTDNAEGYRWVTRLASLAQEWFLEKSDPLHPEVFLLQDAHRKLLVDNPDVGYWFSVLDDRHLYRLTGWRGEAPYVGLTFGTPMAQGPTGGRTGHHHPGPPGPVRARSRRRGGRAHRPGRSAPRTPSGQLGGARARHRPGGLPRDLLRQAPGAGMRAADRPGRRGRTAGARRGRLRREAGDGRAVRAVRGGHRPQHVARHPSPTPTPSGARPARSTWPPRRTRSARTAPRT